MQNRTPVLRDERPPLPDFAPVPRKIPRHDGWTPERQKAFIEALADTGSVRTAARMVNMSSESAYFLRRQPGAESFRRAWEAALDFGVQRLKDEAFERAMNGQLVPVFVAGKLMGFRRKKNDRLLMFCLRHYGQDAGGRRVTVNYFSSKATATTTPPRNGEGNGVQRGGGAGGAAAGAAVEASTTAMTTITSPPGQSTTLARLDHDDRSADILNAFEGADLDAEAQAEILRVLEAAAERRRALAPEDDPDRPFIHHGDTPETYLGELELGTWSDDFLPFREGELGWEGMGEGGENAEIERVLGEMEAERRPACAKRQD